MRGFRRDERGDETIVDVVCLSLPITAGLDAQGLLGRETKGNKSGVYLNASVLWRRQKQLHN